MFSLIPTSKQIGSQVVLTHDDVNRIFHKKIIRVISELLSLNCTCAKYISRELQQTNSCGSTLNVIQFARKWTPKFLISHTTVTLNDGQGHRNYYQNVEFRVSICIPSLKEICKCLNTRQRKNIFNELIVGFLSLEYEVDDMN